MRNYDILNIDVRKVVGTFHNTYNQDSLSWHLFFQMPEMMYVPYFEDHLRLIKENQVYFHNRTEISKVDDYVEYVSYDGGQTFYIQNGNRRNIIAKHYFSAEEFFTGTSDYILRNAVVHFIIKTQY